MKRNAWFAGILIAVLVGVFQPGIADQKWKVYEDDEWCDDHGWGARYCEVRETTLKANRKVIDVDGGDNGGIRVTGWDRDDILLRAKIHVSDGSDDDARELASKIKIETGRTIRADGPKRFRRKGWSVSFELMVPHRSNLSLETTNGGISIEDVRGDMDFDATNGGITLSGVAGHVRGSTTNGGVHITFEGDEWKGKGLNVRTTNGGVTLRFPEDYSADLITGTTNGSIHLDSPMMLEGRIGKRIKTTLGKGGPELKVITTNGGVKIRRG